MGPGRLAALERWLHNVVTILDRFPCIAIAHNSIILVKVINVVYVFMLGVPEWHTKKNSRSVYNTAGHFLSSNLIKTGSAGCRYAS